ncbi:phenoloxidase-activating factor 3-like [Drosophila busckii]|uniref:phenoloxidase-activating factor 3-like n=1 Tax=Drosophila busckii TaxID=30019 RepID=UPI00083EE07A|nr:phenoloxidase-activating factor 3-like [Drosophila busckii]
MLIYVSIATWNRYNGDSSEELFFLLILQFIFVLTDCTGDDFVLGGEPAEPKEFAFMARLGNRNGKNVTNWLCGGTLINNRVVLTAAHCLYSEIGAVNMVRLGELDFDEKTEDADPEDFGVQSATAHPGYNPPNVYNDIALIELDRVVTLSRYKQPACLPLDNGDRVDKFIAIGWGAVSLEGSDSSLLLKVELHNYGNDCPTAKDIEELPNGFNASTQLCIGSAERKDTCNGDSGGPALSFNTKDPCLYRIMGITSIGNSCGHPNSPTFYTRVHFYLNWIKQQIEKSK